MTRIILTLIFGFFANIILAQEAKELIYNPEADAKAEIENAIIEAQSQGKHILLEIGGNWCGWCKLFYELTSSDKEIKDYLDANYKVVYVNYSKENTNSEILSELRFPHRFGFPVFVILDENGEQIHTQNSAYLEEGKGYDRAKVLEFLKQWSPKALDPNSYVK